MALGCSSSAAGQAWVQAPGQAFVKVSTQRTSAAEQYRADGTRGPYSAGLDVDGFEDQSHYLYAEVGVLTNLTAILQLPYKRLTVRTPHPQQASGLPGTDQPITNTADGFEKVQLGVRWSLKEAVALPEAHAMALNLAVRVPTGYDREAQPSIGSGQVDVDAMVHYGLSLWPFPGYAQAGLGYRFRTGLFGLSDGEPASEIDFGNEWLIHGEGGVNLGSRVLLQALLFGTISNTAPEEALDTTNPVPRHQRYLKTGMGVTVYPVSRLGLSVQVFGTPYGASTVRSTDWFFGLETRLGR